MIRTIPNAIRIFHPIRPVAKMLLGLSRGIRGPGTGRSGRTESSRRDLGQGACPSLPPGDGNSVARVGPVAPPE